MAPYYNFKLLSPFLRITKRAVNLHPELGSIILNPDVKMGENATASIKESSSLLSKLRDWAECSICLDVRPSGPIYQCLNGHILCDICFDKVKGKFIQALVTPYWKGVNYRVQGKVTMVVY